MKDRDPSLTQAIMPSLLAGAAVLLGGGGAVILVNASERREVYDQQLAELEAHPETFVVSAPIDQPPGKVIATWDNEASSFRLRRSANGEVSLSDAYEPSAVLGRRSAPIVPCSTLELNVHATHTFKDTDKSYKVVQTYLGNAAVCDTTA